MGTIVPGGIIIMSSYISRWQVLVACDNTTSCRTIVTNVVVAINAADGAIRNTVYDLQSFQNKDKQNANE